jgi:hypothetical protein
MKDVCSAFPDKRKSEGVYSMTDIGLSAFSLFFMQSESSLSYRRSVEEGRKISNCRTLFGMAKIPTDHHIRSMLDPAHRSFLQPAFDHAVAALRELGGMKAFQRLDGRTLIALDGTEYFCSQKLGCPHWESAVSEDLLGKWAMNQMLINVSTRRFKRSVRLPEGDVPAPDGAGLSKSATSRRFVALSAARMKAWMETRLDDLDLLAIQIDGIHMDEDMLLVAAIGVDETGDKHPLGLVEGATENATTVQALIDNLIERGLDPTVRRLFIIDGSKALSKAIRRTFGRDAAIQRCQIHKARNILERLPKSMHASVRRVLRQAWEMDDAEKAERLIRNLARRLERDWSGVSASILEGIDEMLTVTRLGLPHELRRSLACTNIVENVMGTVRRA